MGLLSFHPCMWHSCQENSMASGAVTYPEVLALWLEGDRLALEISLCYLGQGTSHLWACLCFCMNKGTEGMCCSRDVCEVTPWPGLAQSGNSLSCPTATLPSGPFFSTVPRPATSLFPPQNRSLSEGHLFYLLIVSYQLPEGCFVLYSNPRPWHIVGA